MCSSRKYQYSSREGIEISWGGGVEGSGRPKNLKKMCKASLEFQEGWGGGPWKKSVLWGGMDIFWNLLCFLPLGVG